MFEIKVTMLTLLGLIIGSFLNVLIYRIPNDISVAKGRSFCPVCKNQIKWYDNIPIISFIVLRGKCRNCKTQISWIYPFIEFVTMLCFFLIAWFVVDIWQCVLMALVSASLISLAMIDFNTMEIPDRFIIFNIIITALFFFFPEEIIWWERLLGLVTISVPFFIISLLTGGGIGFGDVKLMFSVGLMLGWKNSIVAGLIGCILGGIIGVILMIAKKKGGKSEMPFGPSLVVGIIIAMIFGTQIVNGYLGLMGL